MIDILPCHDRIEELIQFITGLNSNKAHHLGLFGEGEADVRLTLTEFLIPPAEGFRMAYEDGQLAGIFGVDADPEIGRAWLGPIIEHPDWHAVADRLYTEILTVIPAGIREQELFCDVENRHVQDFAARHGFPLTSENAILTLARENYRPSAKGQVQVVAYQEEFFEQLAKLHQALFPNTYMTASQMAEKKDTNHRLLLALDQGVLLGFIFCKIEPESESGYVDFIGTDVPARGRGIGADLLASGVDWMLSTPATKKISLTVNADNVAARNLYEKFGFITERIMRGFRKRVMHEPESRT